MDLKSLWINLAEAKPSFIQNPWLKPGANEIFIRKTIESTLLEWNYFYIGKNKLPAASAAGSNANTQLALAE